MISHGICEKCEEKVLLDIALAEFEDKSIAPISNKKKVASELGKLINHANRDKGYDAWISYAKQRQAEYLIQVGRKRILKGACYV